MLQSSTGVEHRETDVLVGSSETSTPTFSNKILLFTVTLSPHPDYPLIDAQTK